MIKQWVYLWITKKKVNKWVKDKNLFFILAIGRSGTKFLSNLLNKAPRTYIVHEPVRSDFRAYQIAYHNKKKGIRYIEHFRKKEIYIRSHKKDFDIYGEVNSVLRRHYLGLKKAFPGAIFIHLIRDGRDVVRSMMSRRTMTERDPNTKSIFPFENDPWRAKWSEMSRFERSCWYWKTENEYLSKNIDHVVKFEDLVSDYRYFKEKLLNPLNLKISEEVWQKEIESPKNITLKYMLPHWKEWDKELTESFNTICGDIMKDNNYQ